MPRPSVWVVKMRIKRDDNTKPIPAYTDFFSEQAIELIKWLKQEKGRVKSTKLYRAACRVEYWYRKHNLGDASPEIKWLGMFSKPIWLIGAEIKPPTAPVTRFLKENGKSDC